MKSFTNLIGILLILFGIVILAYQGFTYTKPEKVAQFGDIQITQETEKTVYFPPLLGGGSLVLGIVLMILARRGNKP